MSFRLGGKNPQLKLWVFYRETKMKNLITTLIIVMSVLAFNAYAANEYTSTTAFQNFTFSQQSDLMTVNFDVTPNSNNINATTMLSYGPISAYSGAATTVRFNDQGYIDVTNGDTYASRNSYPYTSGVVYHIRMVVDVPNHVYSVYASTATTPEVQLAYNYAFRTGQNAVTGLNNLSIRSETASAATVSGTSALIHDSFNDTNGKTLVNHISDTGSTWVRFGGSGSSYIDANTGGCYSSTDVSHYNTGVIGTNDYSVVAVIRSYDTAVTSNQGVSGRIGLNIHSRYAAAHTRGLGWGLYYVNGYGTEARIGNYYGPTTLPAGDYVVELRMIGTTISMYIDGVLAATGTNTAVTTGPAGIEQAGNGPGSAYEILDFKVIPAGGSVTPSITGNHKITNFVVKPAFRIPFNVQ